MESRIVGIRRCRYCKVNNNTCRQFVAPFIRLRASALPHDTLPRLWHRAYPGRARCGIGCRRGSRQKQKIGGDIIAGHFTAATAASIEIDNDAADAIGDDLRDRFAVK